MLRFVAASTTHGRGSATFLNGSSKGISAHRRHFAPSARLLSQTNASSQPTTAPSPSSTATATPAATDNAAGTTAAAAAPAVFEPFPLIDKLLDRQPLAIARAITLVESSNAAHAEKISKLLRELRVRRGKMNAARRAEWLASHKGKEMELIPLPPPPDAFVGDERGAGRRGGAHEDPALSGLSGSGEIVQPSALSSAWKNPSAAEMAMEAAMMSGGDGSSVTAAEDSKKEKKTASDARSAGDEHKRPEIAPHNKLHSLFALNLEANRRHAVGSMRIAVSGSPGSGKSTFIESLGMLLTSVYDLRVGVIAVDPSSVVSGGSLLGDKTRMEKLGTHPNAFIRPSPSRGHLGGVTARCWESLEILEAADFDVLLIETVGVGQSEIAARNMADLFLLLVPPASGDELQGIKKGIVEVADIVVVTKDDGERRSMAQATQMAYTRAVMFQKNSHNIGGAADPAIPPHRGGGPLCETAMSDTLKPVVRISSEDVELKNQNDISRENALGNSMTNNSIARLWNTVERIWLRRRDQGRLSALRKRQCMDHFNEYFNQELIAAARKLLGEAYLTRLEDEVVARSVSPRQAGDVALRAVLRDAVAEGLPSLEKE